MFFIDDMDVPALDDKKLGGALKDDGKQDAAKEALDCLDDNQSADKEDYDERPETLQKTPAAAMTRMKLTDDI